MRFSAVLFFGLIALAVPTAAAPIPFTDVLLDIAALSSEMSGEHPALTGAGAIPPAEKRDIIPSIDSAIDFLPIPVEGSPDGGMIPAEKRDFFVSVPEFLDPEVGVLPVENDAGDMLPAGP